MNRVKSTLLRSSGIRKMLIRVLNIGIPPVQPVDFGRMLLGFLGGRFGSGRRRGGGSRGGFAGVGGGLLGRLLARDEFLLDLGELEVFTLEGLGRSAQLGNLRARRLAVPT